VAAGGASSTDAAQAVQESAVAAAAGAGPAVRQQHGVSKVMLRVAVLCGLHSFVRVYAKSLSLTWQMVDWCVRVRACVRVYVRRLKRLALC
jgi:hypothetical protein